MKIAAFLLITLLGSTAALAQVDTLEAIKQCKSIEDNQKRLECFDNIPTESVTSTGPIKNEQPKTLDDEDDFGAEDIKERRQEADKQTRKRLDAGLIEAGRNRSGKFFFILDNGQVWRQIPADTNIVVLPRDLSKAKVTIKKKFLGGHILKLGSRSIRVKRIK